MNMLNMLRLESHMTFKARFKAMRSFMVLATLLAMMQVVKASTDGVGVSSNVHGNQMPKKRRTWGWGILCALALIAIIASFVLPNLPVDNNMLDYNGSSGLMWSVASVTAIAVFGTCIAQTIGGLMINKSIREYEAGEKFIDGEHGPDFAERAELRNKIIDRTTISRNFSFVMAVLAIAASIILGFFMFFQANPEGEGKLIGKTMMAATCLGVLTVGVTFMMAASYKGTVDGKDRTSNWGDNVVSCFSTSEETEMTWKGFFFKSKSLYLGVLLIVCIFLAGNNVFGGEDGIGNSEITKMATLVFGSTLLGALVIGGIMRGIHFKKCKQESKAETFTHGEWKKYEKKSDCWSKALQVIVLAVALGVAIWLTSSALQAQDLVGNGGQALGTIWVLFAISFFGFIRLGLTCCDAPQQCDDHQDLSGKPCQPTPAPEPAESQCNGQQSSNQHQDLHVPVTKFGGLTLSNKTEKLKNGHDSEPVEIEQSTCDPNDLPKLLSLEEIREIEDKTQGKGSIVNLKEKKTNVPLDKWGYPALPPSEEGKRRRMLHALYF